MLRSALVCLFALVLASCQSAPSPIEAEAGAAHIERPFVRATNAYYRMLLARQFDELDRIAEQSRKSNATIVDGQSRLNVLYAGVAGCITNGCEDGASEPERRQRHMLLMEWRKTCPESITAEIAIAAFLVEEA